MKTTTYREQLLNLADRLGITDEEAGETQWAAYLTETQLEDAICRLRPEARIVAGAGEDREEGVLDHFQGHMAVVRWQQGTVTTCHIDDIDVANNYIDEDGDSS